MLEYLLDRRDSVVLVMELLYNILDTDEVIENDFFYFNPFSDDDDMPSFWVKGLNLQVAWYSDNPTRGTSCNFDPDVETALLILDLVRSVHLGNDPRGKEETS